MVEPVYPCRLYLVSPPALEPLSFTVQLKQALAAGDVSAFQLRLKNADDATVVQVAEALLPVTRDAGVAFILNDRPDLARRVGADGVHLGQEDMPLREARALVGDGMAIGVSCHDSRHLAMEAGEAGADYVAFGAFFATQSKSPEKLAQYGTPNADMLEWWSTYTTVPSVAIGGMTPENCEPLVAAGADFIAAITAVWSHPHGAAAGVEAFNAAIKRGLKRRA